jgi:hypothetical protein
MGDIGSHARITQHVVTQLRRIVPAASIPEADYTYLELGNFLTDVSQFRDPPAFHRAREVARQAARAESSAAGLAGVDAWANGMFGRVAPEEAKHGWLPEFLRLLMYAFTHEVFDTDGLPRLGAGLGPGFRGAALVPRHGIEPAAVDSMLADRFTQYWPHEHLDFPPVPVPAPVEDESRHREHWRFQREDSGLIGYLEKEHLQYLSEELTKLEEAWVRARKTSTIEQQRRDFLARLGHLLHGVEDYYFHSNFVELRQSKLLRRTFRDVDPTTPAGRARLVERSLFGTGLDTASVRLRRLFSRRLRYPVFTRDGRLSTTLSEDGSDLLYTGGFGQTDVWHTLGGALEAMEQQIAQLPPTHDPRRSGLVLVRLMLSVEARRAMVHERRVAALRDEHGAQLTAGAYPRAVARWRELGLLSRRAAEVLNQAFTLDQRREAEYRYLPGPGGVLITMLDQLQRERDTSAEHAARLDTDPASGTFEGSSNGSTAENVGTHSLLSKDSTDREPFRADAVALASYASAGIATVLLHRVESRKPIDEGIDWDRVVRFFVAYPSYRSRRWEEKLLEALRRRGASFTQPRVERPEIKLLGPRFQPEQLAARRAGSMTKDLEGYYQTFESNP